MATLDTALTSDENPIFAANAGVICVPRMVKGWLPLNRVISKK